MNTTETMLQQPGPEPSPGATHLSPVYVNDTRIRLEGVAKPRVHAIVKAAGHDPAKVMVYRLGSSNDPTGKTCTLDDVIDRTEEPTMDVRLKCVQTAKVTDLEAEGGGFSKPVVRQEIATSGMLRKPGYSTQPPNPRSPNHEPARPRSM